MNPGRWRIRGGGSAANQPCTLSRRHPRKALELPAPVPEPRPTILGFRSVLRLLADTPTRPFAVSPIRVHPAKLVIYPLFPAPVLNRWFRRSRRLSLLAMRPPEAQAISGGGPARDLDRQTRPSRTNWLHVIMAAAGITLVSSVAGVLAYNWYFDTTLVALSSSLQPISSAFHQLGGSHLRQPSSPTPGN